MPPKGHRSRVVNVMTTVRPRAGDPYFYDLVVVSLSERLSSPISGGTVIVPGPSP